ncbi:MAG: hypothetical protein ACRC8U_04530 [Brooklawnia sp.]
MMNILSLIAGLRLGGHLASGLPHRAKGQSLRASALRRSRGTHKQNKRRGYRFG